MDLYHTNKLESDFTKFMFFNELLSLCFMFINSSGLIFFHSLLLNKNLTTLLPS